MGLHPACEDQVGGPRASAGGLAGARSGDDLQRPVAVGDDLQLLGIELRVEVADDGTDHWLFRVGEHDCGDGEPSLA